MKQRLIAELLSASSVHLLSLYLSLAKVFEVLNKFTDMSNFQSHFIILVVSELYRGFRNMQSLLE